MKTILVFVAVCTLLAGCESEIEPIVYAGRGGMSPSTEFHIFKSTMDDYIRRELAGEKLEDFTWKQFWRIRYREIRRVDDHAKAEQEISYIYQQRLRFGLPLYDS